MTTCPCGTTVTNAWICNVCKGRLARDLRSIADLWPDSENVLTRQTRTGVGGGKGRAVGNAKSTPLPYDERASEVRWIVENTVTTWARDMCDEQIPEGVTDVPAAAAWMSQNLSAVVRRQESVDLLAEIDDACRQLVRLVDRPEAPAYLGTHECGSEVWAKSHHAYQTCDCGTVLDLDLIRTHKMLSARDYWASARAICAAAKELAGVHITRVMISRWYRSGALTGNHRYADDQRTLEFRIGAVVDLARKHAERNEKAS